MREPTWWMICNTLLLICDNNIIKWRDNYRNPKDWCMIMGIN